MNIEQIYGEQKPWLDRKVSEMYNSFVKDLESDCDYTLSDDEISELFNELMFIHLSKNMSDYELMRCYNNTLIK